jgi:hypothetical protein
MLKFIPRRGLFTSAITLGTGIEEILYISGLEAIKTVYSPVVDAKNVTSSTIKGNMVVFWASTDHNLVGKTVS